MTRRAPRAAPIVLPTLCATCRAQLAVARAERPGRPVWLVHCPHRETLGVLYRSGRVDLVGTVDAAAAAQYARLVIAQAWRVAECIDDGPDLSLGLDLH